MRSRQQFVFARRVVLFLFCTFALFCAAPSDAHMYFSFPSDSEKTGQVDIYTTFSLEPPTPDESGYESLQYDIKGSLVGPSGTSVAVSGFPFSNSKTGTTYTAEQLAAMSASELAAVDSRKSTVSVSSGGTSVFLTEAAYSMEEGPFVIVTDCTSKAFLNLMADGASTKAYFSSGLELVPVDELAGVTPVTYVRVKALLDGAPVPNLEIKMTYEGCPHNPELDEEVATMRVATTGSDGIARFLSPSSPGNVYFFAMNITDQPTETTYIGQLASLSFVMGGGEEELDVSDYVFSNNAAGIGTPIYGLAEMNKFFLDTFNIVMANDLMSYPAATSAFVTGLDGQLEGEGTGVTFSIPMDITGAGVKGAIGMEQELEVTPDMVGQSRFDDMVAFLKRAKASNSDRFASEGGVTFYMPYVAGDFLNEFDLYIMSRFTSGTVRDMSDNFMLGVLYDEDMFDDGSMLFIYGALYVDSVSDNGNYITDLGDYLGEMMVKMPLIHDGTADNKIAMTYWLAGEESSSSGSSGCNAGLPLFAAIFAMVGLGLVARKKR